MKKQKQIHEEKLALARRYFKEQKIAEITTYVKIALLYVAGAIPVVFIPYLIGHYFTNRISVFCGPVDTGIAQLCGPIGQWFLGIGYVFVPLLSMTVIGLLIFMIGVSIYEWLNDNWILAKHRAGLK